MKQSRSHTIKPRLSNLSEHQNHPGTLLEKRFCGFPKILIQEVWLGPRNLHFKKQAGDPVEHTSEKHVEETALRHYCLGTPNQAAGLTSLGFILNTPPMSVVAVLPSRPRLSGPDGLARESNCRPPSQPRGATWSPAADPQTPQPALPIPSPPPGRGPPPDSNRRPRLLDVPALL